jgi:hypothetical protein
MQIYYTDIYKALKWKKLKELAQDEWGAIIAKKKIKTRNDEFYLKLIFMEEYLKKDDYINDDLSLTKKWEIFVMLYERKWLWIIPVWCIEFHAKDFPFISGALVFILGTVIVELLKFFITFLD